MPKVSVIVPVYNVERYLKVCLDSIVNQTFKDIEIICVNDASQDGSLFILNEYVKKDLRIKSISHKKNAGLGAARNTGIAHATAQYIAFVDSDDYIAPEFIETLYALMNSSNAQMSWCGINTISETGQILESYEIPENIWSVLETLNDERLYPSILSLCNKLFKRSLFNDIRQLPIVSEDQPALAEYLTRCSKVATTSKTLYFYRQNNNTLSKPIEPKAKLWDDFFYSHHLFFEILNQKYPDVKQLRKQAILRYFSMLWRIKSFNILDSSSWVEHEQQLNKHLREDKIGLKRYSPLMYRYMLFIFSNNWNKKIKKNLIQYGITLSRNRWVKCDSFLNLPIDIVKVLMPQIKLLAKVFLDKLELISIKQIALIHKLFKPKPVWLIGERPDTAQDNGFVFFRYLKINQPQIVAFYIIDKESKHYNKVKHYKSVIQFNSFKHKFMFLRCAFYATSHNHYCRPITNFGKKRYRFRLKTKNIFLQHGITFNDVSSEYGKKSSLINIFICGAKPEYEFVKEKFGYSVNDVKFTGFARFDVLHSFKPQKQILLMPTWRKSLWESKFANKHDFFLNSDYYKVFQSLINNLKLEQLLKHHDYRLVFYPHYEIQPYLNYFTTRTESILIASKNDHSVQDLLTQSALLITDYSSVSFDFAYMYKPIIYYLFDHDDFVKNHLKPGYYDHKKDGFGDVVESENDLIQLLSTAIENKCTMPNNFKDKVSSFFPLHDKNNCERIYNEVIKL